MSSVDGVVLVPGVGIGVWSFEAVAAELGGIHRVVLHERSAGVPFSCQVDELAELVGGLGGPAVVVGVSGGATLTLALAMRRPGGLAAAVVHEPLVGCLVPSLHARVCELRDRLAGDEVYGAAAVVAELVGVGTWNRLPEARRAEIAAGEDEVAADMEQFCSFQPAVADLVAVQGLPMVASHGRRSGAPCREVGRLLAENSGARDVPIPECGHLAQLDNPRGLARVVEDLVSVGRP